MGLRGGGLSRMRTGLHLKFPANREINREFRQIRPSAAILAPSRRANSMACRPIPYLMEQGILAGATGNFCGRTRKYGCVIAGRIRAKQVDRLQPH
jgi:hypothetical protein